MRKNKMWILFGAFAVGVMISFVGCGKNDGGLPPGYVGGAPGYYGGGYPISCPPGVQNPSGFACVYAGVDFATACYMSNTPSVQTSMTTMNGVPVCRTHGYGVYYIGGYQYSYGGSAGFAMLTPSTPQGGYQVTSAPLLRGDRVVINANGSWGSSSVDVKHLFWGIPYTSYSCGSMDIDGDGQVNEGYPAGFMVSDGGTSYYVGHGNTISILNDGLLHMGINAPYSFSGSCGYVQATVDVYRCIDAAGNRYSC